ncbi:MAG: hypothetical protein JW706_10305 [Opitutales bacterium]|nr:hypothetical protein [Opitutales bacterium]
MPNIRSNGYLPRYRLFEEVFPDNSNDWNAFFSGHSDKKRRIGLGLRQCIEVMECVLFDIEESVRSRSHTKEIFEPLIEQCADVGLVRQTVKIPRSVFGVYVVEKRHEPAVDFVWIKDLSVMVNQSAVVQESSEHIGPGSLGGDKENWTGYTIHAASKCSKKKEVSQPFPTVSESVDEALEAITSG